MGRCLACDKKGLFLRINSQGICSKCELQFQKEGTEDLFRKLLQLYTSIKNNVSVSDDPIERLNEIVKFEKKLMECEELKQEAEKIRCNETFRKYLRTKLYYAKDSDEATGLSTLRHFGTTIWTGRYSEDDPCQKLADELTEQSEKYLNGWKRTIEMIKKGAEFEKTLRTLPEVEIDLSQDPIPLKEIVNLDSLIKYSRVTSKTNYSRIGNFIAVDIETTGLSSINDNITEISAIKFEDWIPVRIFHTFINPSVEIPDVIVEKTGITNEMVAEAPVFYEIVPSLEDFIGGGAIVGHNLPFDLKFLYRNGYDFTTQKRKYYDTLALIKSVLKAPGKNFRSDYDVADYKLTTLCDYYGIRGNESAHRSSSDAMAAGMVFKEIVRAKAEL